MSGQDLLDLAENVFSAKSEFDSGKFHKSIERLEKEATALQQSWSGSNLGYHADIYYKDLKPRPPGAQFSREWGMKHMPGTSLGSRGEWAEFSRSDVKSFIRSNAGNPDLSTAVDAASKLRKITETAVAEAASILNVELSSKEDAYLRKQLEKLEGVRFFDVMDIISIYVPMGQIVTRDMIAAGQGSKAAPHQEVLAEAQCIIGVGNVAGEVYDILKQAGSHLMRLEKQVRKQGTVGTNVFIGHGRAFAWRDLKDFVKDRLRLPYDEFNRVPVAGFTNIARLSEMMDAAAIAFIVLTAEDELKDGTEQARMNVIHEVGLFQGRLGFSKAIVLLEDGCAEFSNIQGLGQIRFPKDNIKAAFEEIRRVLEREGLIEEE